MKTPLIGIGAILAALWTPAFAADMPLKAPPAAAPASPWTGFYVGVNAGAGWLDNTFITGPAGTLETSPFSGSLGWGESASATSNVFFTGGGQLGYNQQINNFVIGLETDLEYLNASTNVANSFVSVATVNTHFQPVSSGWERRAFGWVSQ